MGAGMWRFNLLPERLLLRICPNYNGRCGKGYTMSTPPLPRQAGGCRTGGRGATCSGAGARLRARRFLRELIPPPTTFNLSKLR